MLFCRTDCLAGGGHFVTCIRVTVVLASLAFRLVGNEIRVFDQRVNGAEGQPEPSLAQNSVIAAVVFCKRD